MSRPLQGKRRKNNDWKRKDPTMSDLRDIPWKRLLVEGAAILASILLAFAIDAWWQDHSDQIRLNEYLSQVHADTLENQRRLREALQLEKGQLGAVQEILAVLRSRVPMTLDSAREWTQMEPGFIWFSDPRLLNGAITALVATGDINLLHNPRVKTALINYLGQLEADAHEFDRGVNRFLVHHDELLRAFELARIPGVEPGKDALADELLSIQEDKSAAAVFRLLEKNILGRIWYLEQMLAATEELSGQLDSEGIR
jgi:hypothetical protein